MLIKTHMVGNFGKTQDKIGYTTKFDVNPNFVMHYFALYVGNT
jgi:hypothetical protein